MKSEIQIFWKYLSPSFIKKIDFKKSSTTIKLYPEDEIKDTDESMDIFCGKLDQVIDTHLFLSKLDNNCLTKEDALKIIYYRCEEISLQIDSVYEKKELRDIVSRRIVIIIYMVQRTHMILEMLF